MGQSASSHFPLRTLSRHNPTDSFQTSHLTSRSINTQWRTPLNGANLYQSVGYGHLQPGFRHSSSYKPITVPQQLSCQCAICNHKWYGFAQPCWTSFEFFFRISLKVVRKICRIVNIFIELTLRVSHLLCINTRTIKVKTTCLTFLIIIIHF